MTESQIEPSLESLVNLPATVEIESVLATADRDLAYMRERSSTQRREYIDSMNGDGTGNVVLGSLSKRADEAAVAQYATVHKLAVSLTNARRRDALQAERPDGCTCLGLAGFGSRWVPGSKGSDDAVQVHETYCSCPDGQRLQSYESGIKRAFRDRMQHAVLRTTLKLADVPVEYRDATFDSYPADEKTAADVDALRAWAETFTPEGVSLLLWGLPGTGKTGLAVATMKAVVAQHQVDSYFTTVPDLLDEIRATFDQPSHRKVRHEDGSTEDVPTTKRLQDAVRNVPLLVLDDIGVERPSDFMIEELWKLINYRHNEHKRTIYTSNLKPSDLGARLGERTFARIAKMSEIRHIVGRNLREKS